MEDEKKLLLRSYDDVLTDAENKRLREALVSSASLQREKEELDRLRHRLSDYRPDFSASFYEKVMARFPEERVSVFLSVFRAVALSGVAAIVLVLLAVYFMDGSLNIDTLLGINGYAPDLGMLSMF